MDRRRRQSSNFPTSTSTLSIQRSSLNTNFQILHISLPFLDVQVHLDNSLIETDLHTEPTDKHQYLLKTSCHPAHTKRTIPFSLALRLRRICSTDDFFNKLCDKLINFLELRGYSRHFFKKEINQARFIPR